MKHSVLLYYNRNIIFFAILGLIFGLIVSRSVYPTALYTLFLATLLIVFLSFYSFSIRLKEQQYIFFLMLFSFIVKLISVFIFEDLMIKSIGIPFLSYKDDYIYDISASEIYLAWENRGFGFYDDIKFSTGFYAGYPNISALAKYLLGDSHLVPRFLNVFFSILTIPLFFATSKYLTNNNKLSKLVAIIFAFSPAFVFYSSLQLKDTILIFFTASLLYGTANFFSKGTSIKNILIVAVSISALIFFRAAILMPYVIALIFSSLAIKNNNSSKLKSFIWAGLIIIIFYMAWGYLYNAGLLALTGEEYFESRFSGRNDIDIYQGSNDLEKLGVIAVILAPLLAILSFFLPPPVYLQLDEFSTSIPYHYFPLIGYYAILPMGFVCLLYVIKNYRIYKIGTFLLVFLVLYKLGQAGSKSIFDSRQSLPAIYVSYLFLSYFDLRNINLNKIWISYKIPVFLVMIIVMFSFTFLRYSIRT